MGDKLSNILIVFIMLIIFGLGGIYYTKVTGSQNHATSNSASVGELIQENIENELNTNENIISSNENKATIAGVADNNSNIYSQNTNAAGYKYNNKYYYNYLSDGAKILYDAIVNNIDKLKTGNNKIEIDYDFGTLLNNENGQEILNDYYDDAINAINLDIPNLFYLDFSKMYLNIERSTSLFSTKYKLYIDPGEYGNYLTKGFDSNNTSVEIATSQIEVAKNQIKTTLTGTDYTKIKLLHDLLIDYMSYNAESNNKASVYGALIEKKGVCEAYARTYKYILDEIGIENILVTGTATNSTGLTEDHMWNYVKLNGKWYAVDVTWDDPIILGGGVASEETKHKYFLKGSQEFYKNHTEKLTISSSGRTFSLPKLELNNY